MKLNRHHVINLECDVHSVILVAAPRYPALFAILCGYDVQEELDIMAYWRHCDVYFQRPQITERQS